MTSVLGLDPGTEQSALVEYDGQTISSAVLLPNAEMREHLKHFVGTVGRILVIESVESFGMPVGREVFRTVFWSGRFAECFGGRFDEMPRRTVKTHLCGSMRAKDTNIRQALIDRFGGDKAIGSKSNPGPMNGITSHKIAALAVAVTWFDLHAKDGDLVRPNVAAGF